MSLSVKSSVIAKLAYKKRILYVKMVNGSEYEYRNVPRDVAVRFASAESKGKFFNSEIAGVYDSEKLN